MKKKVVNLKYKLRFFGGGRALKQVNERELSHVFNFNIDLSIVSSYQIQ